MPSQPIPLRKNDWRCIDVALSEIPSEGYCDQPYAVVNQRGEWVVVMTTGRGVEGEPGQHTVSTISRDRGRTWGPLVDVEPADGPEASWATCVMIPSGRIFVFYTYNADNLRQVLAEDGQYLKRVDTLGKLVFKFSDDGGHSWSVDRFEVPIRSFAIDRSNVYEGKHQFFWSIAKPILHQGSLYLALSKVGNFGEGFMASGTGAIVVSRNLANEERPGKFNWETLPDGDAGLPAPEGRVADEHNIVALSEGSLYCVYRTNQGHNVQAYSRDGGRTWSQPEWGRYRPEGRLIKQPRCLNKVHRFANGKYALFFHNNGGRHYSPHPLGNRNPTWIAGGIERDGFIHWSEPEILLYDHDYARGISYPDWVEDQGEYFFTETQKTRARVHQIPTVFMEMLWAQATRREVTRTGLLLEVARSPKGAETSIDWPRVGKLSTGDSFALELAVDSARIMADRKLLDTRLANTTNVGVLAQFAGTGVTISQRREGALEILLDDGRSPLWWSTEPGAVPVERPFHLVVNVDADSKVLTLVINGQLYDGGDRPFGYARFNPFMYDVNGLSMVQWGRQIDLGVALIRVYGRSLFTSEAVGNYRAFASD